MTTTENVFSAVLTLSVLAGGAVAFGSDVGRMHKAPAEVAVVTLPAVTVVGRRVAAAEPVTLPGVTVVGRRAGSAVAGVDPVCLPTVTVSGRRSPTAVAVETESVEQRVQ